jgi:hypothetical protein
MHEKKERDMLNKIVFLPTLLWMCISLPSYAYVIGANLTIENATDVPMELTVYRLNGQDSIHKSIPAHQTTPIYMENGDHSGYLYQAAVAPFSIRDAKEKTEYVNGRVAYYVGAAFWSKYSFLDSVLAGPGITLDQSYSCGNGGSGTIFENKIILSGHPGEAAPINPHHPFIRCEGLKASELTKDQYLLKCSNNTEVIFSKLFPSFTNEECQPGAGKACHWWTGNRNTVFSADPYLVRNYGYKYAIDKGIGTPYCQTFEELL